MEVNNLENFRDAIKRFGFERFWDEFILAYISKKSPDLTSAKSNLILDFKN